MNELKKYQIPKTPINKCSIKNKRFHATRIITSNEIY